MVNSDGSVNPVCNSTHWVKKDGLRDKDRTLFTTVKAQPRPLLSLYSLGRKLLDITVLQSLCPQSRQYNACTYVMINDNEMAGKDQSSPYYKHY